MRQYSQDLLHYRATVAWLVLLVKPCSVVHELTHKLCYSCRITLCRSRHHSTTRMRSASIVVILDFIRSVKTALFATAVPTVLRFARVRCCRHLCLRVSGIASRQSKVFQRLCLDNPVLEPRHRWGQRFPFSGGWRAHQNSCAGDST